jgi:uncharacterized membrane protein YhaH (DUF805 family)
MMFSMRSLTDLIRFDGRLSRQGYWSAIGLLFLGQVATGLILAQIGGVGLVDFVNGSRKAAFVNLVVVALSFWPSLAVTVRRLHDRDLPGWWGGLLHVLVLLFYARTAFTSVPVRIQSPSLLTLWPEFLMLGISAWLIVELVFRHGAPGPNRFGDDPCGADSTAQSNAAAPGALLKPGE